MSPGGPPAVTPAKSPYFDFADATAFSNSLPDMPQ
jgi:hypothetical protein